MHVVHSPRHAEHAPAHEISKSQTHAPFEHPGRADSILAALVADDRFRVVAPAEWGTAPIESVHDPGLVAFLERAWADYQVQTRPSREVVPDVFALAKLRDGMGPAPVTTAVGMQLGEWCFETTTPLTEGTFTAARAAVDVALTTTQLVLDGERRAYGLCRPPGHHAGIGFYGGYCFFNNAAIAAQHLVSTTGGKVTMIDIDYHHGNGTQQIFYGRDDVQYVSLHADPVRAYPFVTGHADETGTGHGRGYTANLPLPALTDDDAFVAALEHAAEVIDGFGPDTVVVSLGLDTYEHDPICDFSLTPDGFERSGALVADLGRPLVILQEGGYATDQLGRLARRWLRGADR